MEGVAGVTYVFFKAYWSKNDVIYFEKNLVKKCFLFLKNYALTQWFPNNEFSKQNILNSVLRSNSKHFMLRYHTKIVLLFEPIAGILVNYKFRHRKLFRFRDNPCPL